MNSVKIIPYIDFALTTVNGYPVLSQQQSISSKVSIFHSICFRKSELSFMAEELLE